MTQTEITYQTSMLTDEKAFQLLLIDDDVLHYKYKDDLLVTLEDVRLAYRLYEKHGNNYKRKVLLSFGAYTSIQPSARDYSEKIEMPTPAQAIVIKNLAQRILAKFYKMIRRDKHPLSFFSNENAAISWLKGFE